MRIAILGAGVEGLTTANYLRSEGEKDITICDEKLASLPKQLEWAGSQLGKNAFKDLEKFDVLYRSPGVAYTRPELDSVRKKLTSQTRYFFEKCPCTIIGVTGTKGKGTTSSLISEMLKKSGRRVFLGGNIGVPPLTFLSEVNKDDVVVLELSSFQLQDLDASPHIAVVLGISDDHLDQHKTLDEYYSAKKNLVLNQGKDDVAVIEVDSSVSASFCDATSARVFQVSLEKPQKQGAFVKQGMMIVADSESQMIIGEVGKTQLPGVHNVKNMLMAATAAHAAGAPVEAIAEVIREWCGLPHRLQLVAEKEGVKFYNDSASTNPSTTVAALRSFTQPMVLIAGGSDKNLDFAPLAREMVERKNLKRVILMGETKRKIEAAIDAVTVKRSAPLEIIFAESYMEAFMVAKLTAEAGDVVLLSPGCASFDMFKNYVERGDLFTNFVRE